MKRLIIFAAVLLFGLTSCKKDYTCKCEDSDGNVSFQTFQNVSKTMLKKSVMTQNTIFQVVVARIAKYCNLS